MDDPYLIPGSNTLKNKLGLTDHKQLQRYESKLSGARLGEIIHNPVPGKLDYQHLKDIHKHLFQDIYDWAGKPRSINIGKGTTAFAPTQHMDSFAKGIFKDLKAENNLMGLNKNQFIDRAAHYLSEINALHPFREGNGRSQRAFMSTVAERAGYAFNWSRVTPKEMVEASIHSFDHDASKIKTVLEKSLVTIAKKDRDAHLNELQTNDPAAFKAISEMREELLTLSESNISDPTTRLNLSNAITDRLLDYHATGKPVKDIIDPMRQGIQPGAEPGSSPGKGQGTSSGGEGRGR